MVAWQSRTAGRMNGGANRPLEMIGEYPAASMVVLFSVGLGLGLVVGHALSESLADGSRRRDSLVQKLTCQIRSVLKQTLPENIWRQLS